MACWGYFSVWTHAAIHEFADSQFGHLFARGSDREEARKTLVLALKGLEVVGEIRTPMEYLVELLQTEEFRRNRIDTSWLDGLIKERLVKVSYERLDVVFHAAVLRAVWRYEAQDKEFLEAISKRRLGLLHQVTPSTLELQITFEGQSFDFLIRRLGPELYELAINGSRIVAQVRQQPDGALLVSVEGNVTKVSGSEEPLGLRLRLQNVGTVLLPTIFDLSELRSDFNGKVIRYLINEGGAVQKGQAYVELEAMKMIMPLKAGASGSVKHVKQPGSIVQAGELLARLQLDDPSSVPQLEPFQGVFSLTRGPRGEESREGVARALEGYAAQGTASELVDELMAQEEIGSQLEQALGALERYLSVERHFADSYALGKGQDLVVASLLERQEPLEVAKLLRAHQVAWRGELVVELLRRLEGLQALPKKEEQVEQASLARAKSQKLWQSVREEGHWSLGLRSKVSLICICICVRHV